MASHVHKAAWRLVLVANVEHLMSEGIPVTHRASSNLIRAADAKARQLSLLAGVATLDISPLPNSDRPCADLTNSRRQTMNRRTMPMLTRPIMTALVFAAACSVDAPSEPPMKTVSSAHPERQTASLGPGLTILQMTANDATRFAYKEDDRAVVIETRRGPETPPEYLASDDPPAAYATELSVFDRDGSAIYVRAETASSSEPEAEAPSVLRQHAEDVALAPQALRAAAVALAARGQAFAAEQRAVADVATTLDAATASSSADDVAIVSEELTTNSAAVAAAPASRKHAVALYHGELKKLGIRIGWHSSTRVAYYVNNQWTSIHDECNHGRCPGESGMSEVCHYVSAPRTTVRRITHCGTSENFSSIMTHNCNDDSHLQVITLRYDRPYSKVDGACHDKGANPDPDGCDPSTWNVAGNGGGSW